MNKSFTTQSQRTENRAERRSRLAERRKGYRATHLECSSTAPFFTQQNIVWMLLAFIAYQLFLVVQNSNLPVIVEPINISINGAAEETGQLATTSADAPERLVLVPSPRVAPRWAKPQPPVATTVGSHDDDPQPTLADPRTKPRTKVFAKNAIETTDYE